MIDIRKTPDVIDTVNAILSNGGVAEIKQERTSIIYMLGYALYNARFGG